ncbi:LysM peptidoglycan-binding domain-containing protein [Amphritea sp.]|uniref:LysM peptidoglycan-binding domain-containing protein n=1 Tax=Amphritea sp. TaxID=1872502 RepID=UPI003D0B083E
MEGYTVQPGDSLWKIGQKKGISVDGILSENPELKENPNYIVPGQYIRLPLKSSPVVSGVKGPYAPSYALTPKDPRSDFKSDKPVVYGPQPLPTKNLAKTQQAGNSAAAKSQQNCPINTECELNTMIVECGHSSRKYKLDAINGDPKQKGTPKLFCLADEHGHETVKVTFSGCCENGSNMCTGVEVVSELGEETQFSSPAEFGLTSEGKLEKAKEEVERDVGQLQEIFKIADKYAFKFKEGGLPRLATYRLNKVEHGCSLASKEAVTDIILVPTFKGSAFVSFGYDEKKESVPFFDRGGERRQAVFDYGGSFVLGGAEVKVTNKKDTTIDQYFPWMQGKMDGLIQKLDEMAYHSYKEAATASQNGARGLLRKAVSNTDFVLDLPKVKVSFDVETKEAENEFSLDITGTANLEMDPLIGMTINIDILGWAITAIPGIGPFLSKVKGYAQEKGVVLAIILSAENKVFGKLSWEKKLNGDWELNSTENKNEIGGSVLLKLEGKAEMEVETFIVEVKAGAKILAASAKKSSEGCGLIAKVKPGIKDCKPYFDGEIEFTGLSIYQCLYAELGVKSSDNGSASEEETGIDYVDNLPKKDKDIKNEEYKKMKVVLEPCKWPESKNSEGIGVGEVTV